VGALGSSVVRPALTTLLTETVGADERGLALGVNQSLSSLAQIVGPILSGWLIGAGRLSTWAICAAVFAAGGLVIRATLSRPPRAGHPSAFENKTDPTHPV
jgi:MFS family permease